jgi:hypothetical protein
MNNGVKKFVIAPAATGVAAATLFLVMRGNEGSLKVLGMNMGPAAIVGVAAGSAEVVAVLLHDALKKTDQGRAFINFEGMMIAPTLVGLSTLGTISALAGKPDGVYGAVSLFAYGYFGHVGGSYLESMVTPFM